MCYYLNNSTYIQVVIPVFVSKHSNSRDGGDDDDSLISVLGGAGSYLSFILWVTGTPPLGKQSSLGGSRLAENTKLI